MKKTRKDLLGLIGLFVVAVMTMVAASMPGPGASAATTVTDVIEVRVIGMTPDITIGGIINGATYTGQERPFAVSYENVETATITLTYTDANGNTKSAVIDELAPDYKYGTEEYVITWAK